MTVLHGIVVTALTGRAIAFLAIGHTLPMGLARIPRLDALAVGPLPRR